MPPFLTRMLQSHETWFLSVKIRKKAAFAGIIKEQVHAL